MVRQAHRDIDCHPEFVEGFKDRDVHGWTCAADAGKWPVSLRHGNDSFGTKLFGKIFLYE